MNAICKVKEVVTGMWSLVVGMKVTGKNYVLPQITVHYPRETAGLDWEGFRGHPVLVPKPKDPTKPKCIACMVCVSSCPSGCIKVVKAKAPKPSDEEMKAFEEAKAKAEAEGQEAPKPPTGKAPKEPGKWIVNYTTCSQCGTCAEVCPVKSIAYSREVNQAGYSRKDFEAIDCLALLRKQAGQAPAEAPKPKPRKGR